MQANKRSALSRNWFRFPSIIPSISPHFTLFATKKKYFNYLTNISAEDKIIASLFIRISIFFNEKIILFDKYWTATIITSFCVNARLCKSEQ